MKKKKLLHCHRPGENRYDPVLRRLPMNGTGSFMIFFVLSRQGDLFGVNLVNGTFKNKLSVFSSRSRRGHRSGRDKKSTTPYSREDRPRSKQSRTWYVHPFSFHSPCANLTLNVVFIFN